MALGFIGTGVMGTGIINNLLKAGHHVTVYNRTQSKADEVISHGAVWADTPKMLKMFGPEMMGFLPVLNQVVF